MIETYVISFFGCFFFLMSDRSSASIHACSFRQSSCSFIFLRKFKYSNFVFDMLYLSQSAAPVTSPQSQQLLRPILKSYPKKKQGNRERSFQSTWHDSFSWLEYFVNVDACFCYPCKMFSNNSIKEKTFIETGFSNWKTAMESGRGFKKHEQSGRFIFERWRFGRRKSTERRVVRRYIISSN